MKKLINVLVISIFCLLGSLTSTEAAKFNVAIEHDKIVSLTGVVKDVPQKWVSEDGQFETYSFYLAAGSGTREDDYVSVSYKTLILGHKVAEMNFKMGDKVTLSGRISKYHKDEIIFQGKLKVNDYSAKELSKFPKK